MKSGKWWSTEHSTPSVGRRFPAQESKGSKREHWSVRGTAGGLGRPDHVPGLECDDANELSVKICKPGQHSRSSKDDGCIANTWSGTGTLSQAKTVSTCCTRALRWQDSSLASRMWAGRTRSDDANKLQLREDFRRKM